ncbi:hypothetical protein JAAARDRAFT_633297 [Jaapia argillacea MUCL 33604]|uniref:Uncharacterized protein n=1 Tax=Jaapia argillacea MUCL 33604 TaxID=933084 RepID=A0A067PYB2_9AGAM|nr:hypothetical protein JAAARDRAFT_633297 [Jaapia argillacea MUCL 33604]
MYPQQPHRARIEDRGYVVMQRCLNVAAFSLPQSKVHMSCHCNSGSRPPLSSRTVASMCGLFGSRVRLSFSRFGGPIATRRPGLAVLLRHLYCETLRRSLSLPSAHSRVHLAKDHACVYVPNISEQSDFIRFTFGQANHPEPRMLLPHHRVDAF